jgi:hypothetical protein
MKKKKQRVPKFMQALIGRTRQAPNISEQVVAMHATSLREEVDHIVECAAAMQSHVVGFGALVLFSTQTGDAWLLDWEDELALCLVRGGDPQPYALGETDRQIAIAWSGLFHIHADLLNCIDNSTPTKERLIASYPSEAILKTIQRLQRGV